VDDGSTDGTVSAARSAGAEVISHGRNLGLGQTFRTALRYARDGGYHILVTIDSDGQFNPEHIPLLIKPIMDEKADFVTASRFVDPELIPDMPRLKIWGNRRVAKLVGKLSGINIKDATCGFRAYGPAALERLSSFSRFTYTQEVIIDLASKGLTIFEVPVRILGERPVGSSRIASSLWRYAILSLAAMYSISHDHQPWKFYGTPALILLILGIAADLFVLIRWIITGSISPFTAIGLGGLFLITFGVLLFLFASLADTASHNRHLIETVISENVRKNRDGGYLFHKRE
ncbi:MAG: glycosyltransferase family 2 protein, partial [Candidatus Aegiribacteria sp.]|nr:glycosyltransferase family 2 protein [Candidatus Aegiribacteria sp.]